MTGNDKCPLKPFKGIKLINVPKATLREWLYKTEYYNRYPELIRYIHTRFSTQELEVINIEIAEGIIETGARLARQIWNASSGGNIVNISNSNRRTRRPAVPVVIPKKIDKSIILNNDRALEL